MKPTLLAIMWCSMACGRVGFDEVGTDGPAAEGIDPAEGLDATTVTCWPAWRSEMPDISEPVPLTAVNTTAHDYDPVLAANGLRLYFASDRDGVSTGADVWVAERSTPTSEFGPAGRVSGLSSVDDEAKLWLSEDELTGYFSSERAGGVGGADLWLGTRPTRTDSFTVSKMTVDSTNTAFTEIDPYVTPDGLALYFARDDNGFVLMRSVRSAVSSDFGVSAPVSNVFNASVDPLLSADGLIMWFASGVSGSFDVYFAVRADTSRDFDNFRPVPKLTSFDGDRDIEVSRDGCEIIFTRDPAGLTRDIYTARVTPI